MLTTKTKIALARMTQRPIMLARQLVGAGPVAKVRRRGLTWRLDLREGIDFAIYLLGAFEPETVRAFARIIKPGMTVLDIGANVGAHTLQLARMVGPEGRVIAIEPTDWAFAKLKDNLALNPEIARRVTPVQTFLVDRAGRPPEAEIYASWPLDGADVHPKLRGRAMSTEGTTATTLDDLVRDLKLERIDVAKIDVDGHECDVLAGAAQTLKTHKPALIMEFSPYILAEHGGSLDKLVDQLEDAGYTLADLATGAALPQDRAALAALVPDGAGCNVIARPAGAR